MCRKILASAALLSVMLIAAGCSQPTDTAAPATTPVPAPVAVTPEPVVDVTPPAPPAPPPAPVKPAVPELTDPAKPNLIANGQMGQWPENVTLPIGWEHGFGYPDEDAKPAKIERVAEERFIGGLAAEQTWKQSDEADAVGRLFGITVEGLKPNASYKLIVLARNKTGGLVTVSPYAVLDEEGTEARNLNPGFIRLEEATDGLQQYAGVFETGDETTVRLAAACLAEEDAYPVTVVWDAWKLIELPKQ